MAMIGEIRKRGTLILVIIGGALAAFILGDLFSNRASGPETNSAGTIDGQEVDLNEYNILVERQMNAYSEAGAQRTPEFEEQIRNNVWNSLIQEKLLMTQADALGLVVYNEDGQVTYVSKPEFDDLRWGENVSPLIKNGQDFVNPQTQQYDSAYAMEVMRVLEQNYPSYWGLQQNQMRKQRVYTKYNDLVAKAMYVTHLQGRLAYQEKNNKYNINAVLKKYSDIPDEEVTVTEEAMKAYYEEHKDEQIYQREARAHIKYAVFPIEPTEEDIELQKNNLKARVDMFRDAPNDSVFATKYSSDRLADVFEYIPGMSTPDIDKAFANADSGEVIGPFEAGGMLRIAKLIPADTAATPDTVVTSRHILIGFTERGSFPNDTVGAKNRADSIMSALRGGADFGALAQQFSDDPGSGARGGKLDPYRRRAMVAEFDSASFATPVNELTMVKTQYGFHIIEVLSRGETIKAYTVDMEVRPMTETITLVYDQADNFGAANNTQELFEKAASEAGLEVVEAKNLAKNYQGVNDLENSRELVKWAFTNEPGTVSEAMEFNDRIVVATLVGKYEKGPAAFEEVRDAIELEVRKQEKFKLYQSKMQGGSLEEVAANVNTTMLPAQDIAFNDFTITGGGGSEPKVVGKIFGLEQGAVSEPMEGVIGIYVIRVNAVTPAAEATAEDIQTERDNLKRINTSRAAYDPLEALKRKANIEDTRDNF